MERKERIVEMHASKPNVDGIPRRRRAYAVVEAAQGVMEEEIRRTNQYLLEEGHLWEHIIPLSDQTFANGGLASSLTSGAECALSKSVIAAYNRCDIAVFKALISPADAEKLDAKRPCWFSEWGSSLREWLARFGGFGSEEAADALELMAQLILLATSTLESLHATLRRILITRSIQTHGVTFAAICMEWLIQQCRMRSDNNTMVDIQKLIDSAMAEKHSDNGDVGDHVVKNQRAINPWNVHMRLKSLASHERPDASKEGAIHTS